MVKKSTHNALWEELQAHLDDCYAGAKVEAQDSLGSDVYLRFELGLGHRNGTKERLRQATQRAVELFGDCFEAAETELLVLVYEYPNDYPPSSGLHRELTHLYTLFSPSVQWSTYWRKMEEMDFDFKVLIGKMRVADVQVSGVMHGIACSEMGFSPYVEQSVFFFAPALRKAFYMYDDRGCSIWSDDVERLRSIFEQRNEWIVDYHRQWIEPLFLGDK